MHAARLPRILGALVYDTIIVIALIFIAAQWFPLIPEQRQSDPFVTLFKQAYILGISFMYFAWSWRRGGQTIGMKAWRIKLIDSQEASQPVSWRQSAIRFLVAIVSWLMLGLGFVWILFDRKRRSWHDIASGTHLLVIPKP